MRIIKWLAEKFLGFCFFAIGGIIVFTALSIPAAILASIKHGGLS